MTSGQAGFPQGVRLGVRAVTAQDVVSRARLHSIQSGFAGTAERLHFGFGVPDAAHERNEPSRRAASATSSSHQALDRPPQRALALVPLPSEPRLAAGAAVCAKPTTLLGRGAFSMNR
jgi:hypothetical protein